jgi:hypothetical protein
MHVKNGSTLNLMASYLHYSSGSDMANTSTPKHEHLYQIQILYTVQDFKFILEPVGKHLDAMKLDPDVSS